MMALPRFFPVLILFMPIEEDSSQKAFTYASAQRSMTGSKTYSGLQGSPSRNHPTGVDSTNK
jgi:hypothetical protein